MNNKTLAESDFGITKVQDYEMNHECVKDEVQMDKPKAVFSDMNREYIDDGGEQCRSG